MKYWRMVELKILWKRMIGKKIIMFEKDFGEIEKEYEMKG